MLKPSYPIRTDRLILRPFTPDDLDGLHAIQSLPEVARYLYWGPRDLEEVREALNTKITQSALLEEGQALTLAVELAATGELIGDGLLFWHSSLHRSGEIGYVFHPRHHGKGYATEVADALLKLGFDGQNSSPSPISSPVAASSTARVSAWPSSSSADWVILVFSASLTSSRSRGP
ncbi:GNAT family N-acetyltransferase, partial [Streptosporangium minutum]|uniref:GNAT family N-acetyltransferase n=1 Tax=Streptosporangium minutum TaxID=569862 RepID=UPI001F607015